MKHETDIRFHLKLAIIDRESARTQHRAGRAAMTPLPDMKLLDQHLVNSSEDVLDLMKELSAEQTQLDTCANARSHSSLNE